MEAKVRPMSLTKRLRPYKAKVRPYRMEGFTKG
jgi:hypothetical protein